ncbi:MAG: tRNA-dihydrouridine synthase family protein, partial [Lachnospiraceae bacterium]|nr:tRNA-dihydrouridine synthase family protein [Lachnospiraceae bacterium]
APMEGITTYIYRNAYNHYFGGIDKYFTPFIASKKMNRRELNEILPEHNENIHVIPQILTNRADEFLQITKKIAEYGYQTVNLNLGCPSGTVTARKRGAGFLSVPDELDNFLYEIFDKSPIKISIKTRIGVASVDEWARILEIYQKYPMAELIIHPRLQQEFYQLTPHKEAFQTAVTALPDTPLCYNGDITSPKNYEELLNAVPQTNCIMIGRGILKNPALPEQIRQASQIGQDSVSTLQAVSVNNTNIQTQPSASKEQLKAFHNEIFAGYAAQMAGETPTLFKMKDLWTYLSESFQASDKHLKKIRKAATYSEYKIAVNNLFRECELV